jgi:hypothetical protein
MSTVDPKDPRFRPFRIAAWALYLLVVVGFSSLVVFSVFKSVVAMTPDRPAPAAHARPISECAAGARTLIERLEAQRRAFSEAEPTKADQRFLEFRVAWLKDMRALEAQCALREPGRQKLAAAFSELERLVDLYTTTSVQFAGAVAPTLEALQRHLDDVAR